MDTKLTIGDTAHLPSLAGSGKHFQDLLRGVGVGGAAARVLIRSDKGEGGGGLERPLPAPASLETLV